VPLPFVFPYAISFWLMCAWAFLPEFTISARSRRRATQSGSPDAGSHGVILYGMGLAYLAGFALAWVRRLRLPDEIDPSFFSFGLLLLLAGSLLRRHCRRVLGAYFTGDVRAEPTQPVIDRGAYAWVRHPSYSGAILRNFGIGLALGSWGSLALLAAASLAVYRYRMAVEERALLKTLGDPYQHYMAKHKRLIPFLY
jgi:protein-S-isoprenylcysteine O-methyltransferase Ste14